MNRERETTQLILEGRKQTILVPIEFNSIRSPGAASSPESVKNVLLALQEGARLIACERDFQDCFPRSEWQFRQSYPDECGIADVHDHLSLERIGKRACCPVVQSARGPSKQGPRLLLVRAISGLVVQPMSCPSNPLPKILTLSTRPVDSAAYNLPCKKNGPNHRHFKMPTHSH